MKIVLKILALLLFVVSMVIIPSAHKLELAEESHCSSCQPDSGTEQADEESQEHDSEHCPICQLALIPIDSPIPFTLGLVSHPLAEPPPQSEAAEIYIPAHLLPYSCGPPS